HFGGRGRKVMPFQADLRWQDAKAELLRLETEFGDWYKGAEQFDKTRHGQYRSQLSAIQTFMTGGIGRLKCDLNRSKPTETSATKPTFHDCRKSDVRTYWMRRIWRYFADKFDQRRGDDEVAKFLHAADEVVWSCFRTVLDAAERAGHKFPRVAAPMPFVEPW